ncbi:exosortase A [Altererythrobacter atlanticus]|uniref:Transmembrane exosortase n=1 Tax=Croceibacterium atlanticum TaxID=1267766 RepID=A0A0F7KSH0_9SPHN|nr:exosortase A [Croceibacterium atlanticum]AKH41710.1 Transmembrane exosortase [Croceibacterium atlanticum]MBB5733174.1 exosortase A [Croceibacterium atlanticum]
MPRDLAMPRTFAPLEHVPSAWRVPLLHLAFAWLGSILLFLQDWADMAHQWWDSSTYNHILLIPFVLAWLVKLRAPELALLKPQAWWPGLLPVACALFLWLLGRVSGLNFASQLGAVAFLPASLLALMGPRIVAALLFPLFYSLLLVPFGDVLVPSLQMITAELTIALTHWSGIPARIEGVFIDTPAGLFEVAEACSGVKFLIAMIALGALVAHVCFRSWWRRLAFMTAAVALPILANGVRAWGTIYIAQSQGIEFAAGFDHIFYGWVFFALVMLTLLAAGWPFFDRAPEEPFVDVPAIQHSPLLRTLDRFSFSGWQALAAIGLLALAITGWSAAAQRLEAELPAQIALPDVGGWQRMEYRPTVRWEPRAAGADHRLLGRFEDEAGHRVDVFYALYRAQDEGRDAGGFGEGALMPDTAWRWLEDGAPISAGKAEWLQAHGNHKRLAVTWYRTGDLLTGEVVRLKLANMADRITMRPNATATLILSAEQVNGQDPEEAIRAFLSSVGDPGRWMDRVGQRP